jgi:PRTRC genetic system protein F
MMPAATAQALAIPRLAPTVPLTLHITGQDVLVAPLTIALIEADVISAAMLRHPKNGWGAESESGVSARELAMRGLSKWWETTVRANSCKFFRWKLHVQRMQAFEMDAEYNDHAWFIFTRLGDELPRFALEKGVTRLEATLAGLGQTVLAVLKDATMRLPESFNPWRAVDFAEYFYWQDSETDLELLENMRVMNGYDTIQEVLDRDGVITREAFFSELPKWVTAPQRVLSRDAIGSADLGLFGSRVVAACDAIAVLVSTPEFTLHPADCGAWRTRMDSADAAMALLWREGDVIGQVTDDVINDLYNTGEYTDYIDANPVPMTADGIRHFQDLTEQKMKLAVLTEKLILLIGESL